MDLSGTSSKTTQKDPFTEQLEARKKKYTEYYNWVNSKDEVVRNAAKAEFAGLLKEGSSYLDYLQTVSYTHLDVYKRQGHNFKVGDVLMLAPGGAAYAITAIATNSGDGSKDDLTVGTTLGVAAKAGDSLYLAAKAGASGAAFKYTPVALVGESYDVDELSNHIVKMCIRDRLSIR